jgi:hypothetical protein
VRDAAEGQWLAALDAEAATRSIFPWPSWLRVPSPMGALSPGWLVAREGAGGELELALVADAPGEDWRREVLGSLASAIGSRLELRGA